MLSPNSPLDRQLQQGDIYFRGLKSACTTPGVTAAERFDPYWSGIWEQGSSASWLSRDLADRQAGDGLGRLPGHLDIPRDTLLESLRSPARAQSRLNAMSVIDSWRTVTGEQLAAITGDRASLLRRSHTMAELFAAGVADSGTLSSGMINTRTMDGATLYRPSRSLIFDREIAPELTYPEWVSVTAGNSWESGSQYDRHNLLATELALRVAEWCEIGAVVGEKLSSWDLLAYSGTGALTPRGSQRAADTTLIRTDGARIAVEITASTGANFEAKVRGWAELLSGRRMADTGLAVMFVVATRPDKMVHQGEVLSRVRTVVQNAARDYSGVNFDRTASRMFVVDWRDWFPQSHVVTPGFFSLQASRPTGPVGAIWETASALDVLDLEFDPAEQFDALAVLDNLTGIRSVPHWLRTGTTAPLWPLAIIQQGFRGIPVPLPSRPETYIGVPVGSGNGIVGDTRPPLRLRTSAR